MSISIGDALLTLGVDTKDLEKGMKGVGATIKKHQKAIGIGMVAAGGTILAGLGMSLKAAADFESAMREVNTMIGLSQEEFMEFSKEVQTLASDLGVDAVDSANALYQAISAGVPKENVLEFLAIATKAAIGGVTSTEVAVDGLTTVINAFKLPMSDAQKVADVMFTTVKGGKTTFEELSAAMFNVAPIAAAAGFEFEEVAAAIATLTKQGVPTSVATTQIRAAMQQLLKPTKDMTEAIEDAGLAFFEETEESRKATAALLPLQSAIDVADEAFDKQTKELDKLRLSYQLTTAEMANMTEEMDELGDKQSIIRLRMRKIRFAAAQEGRELTDEEKAELEELGLETEKLGIAYAELAIKKDDLGEAAEREAKSIKVAETANLSLADTLKGTEDALVEGKEAFADTQTEMKAFSEILDELNKADLTTQQILKMFGSVEAGSAILALTGENALTFAADLDAMTSAEGAATDAFNEMEQGAKRQSAAITAMGKDIMTTVGNILLPILKELFEALKPIIESVKNWVEENPKLTKVIVIGALAFGALLTVLGSLVLLAPLVGGAFTLMLGPVGLVIVAIAALIAVGVLLWKNWDTIRAKMISIWTDIKFFFMGVWASIKDIFFDNINSIIDKLNSLIDLINIIPGVDIGEIGQVGGGTGSLEGFARGGLITQPTLLTRLGSSTPFGIMAETRPERIGPAGPSVMITGNTFNVRTNADIDKIGEALVRKIRLKGVPV